MSIGKIIKDLAPNSENRRNSEGSFARLSDGRIVFAYSRYRDGMEDGCVCDIAAIFSSDNGESFSEPVILFSPEDNNALNLMSVSLVELGGGDIAVFYLKKMVGLQCIPYMRKTRDFISFTEEVRCIDEPGNHGLLNDRVRKLSDGRLIFCAAYTPIIKLIDDVDHYNLKAEDGSFNVRFEPAIAKYYTSFDGGESWQCIAECEMPYDIFKTGLQEPGVEELANGSLYSCFRNDSGRQFEAYSYDGGRSWTTPAPSRFTSPPAPMCTRKLCDGRFVIIYNPVPLYFGRGEVHSGIWTGGRNPLVLVVADENMKEFDSPIVLENDESRGFAYCAVYPIEDSILLGYCAGGVEDAMMLNRLRIRKIKLSELNI